MNKLIVAAIFFTPLVSMAVCVMPSTSDNQAGAAYRQCVDNEINMERMRQQQEQMRIQQEQMRQQQEQMRQQQEQMRQR